MDDFDLKKVYLKLDDLEKMPDTTGDERVAKLRAYVELRRDLERFLIRTTGSL